MKIADFLGVELPIIQSPMAGVQDSRLSVAVSLAGGLGSLPCAMLGIDELQAELTTMKAQTDNPINLNFFCHTPPSFDLARESKWHKVLQPYFDEFGISTSRISTDSGRQPFSHEMAETLAAHKPAVVSFHFGLPAAELVTSVKACGAKILASATTVEEALWLEAHGADGIIAQGYEAGGHRGMFLTSDLTSQSGTFALLPQILNKVNVPVIAAGGVADSRSVQAALSLGAIAAQVGTAYLLCDETKTSKIHRSAIKSEGAQHTAITNVFSGRPARGIINRVMREIGPMSQNVPDFPLAVAAITAIRKQAESNGSGDFSPLWCGQNATGCKEISAADLTAELINGT